MKKNIFWPFCCFLIISLFYSACDRRENRGSFIEFYGIFTAVEPADLDLYESLLPKPLEMPDQPMVGLFVINYNHTNPWPFTPYLEGTVGLWCSYNGEEGWHVLTMPVTKRVSCEGGRALGFPKYVTKDISLWPADGGWKGEVKHEGELKLTLDYSPGLNRKLTALEEEVLRSDRNKVADPIFQFVPPDKGPDLNRVKFVHLVPPTWTVEEGMVKVTIGHDEPWAGLVKPGTETPGVLQKFTGGASLIPEKLIGR